MSKKKMGVCVIMITSYLCQDLLMTSLKTTFYRRLNYFKFIKNLVFGETKKSMKGDKGRISEMLCEGGLVIRRN